MVASGQLLSVVLLLCIPFAHLRAEAAWQDFSVTLLRGTGYTVDYSLRSDDSTRDVITVEYAAGYAWGDLFTFVDRLASDRHQELYWELQPRVALTPWLGEANTPVGPVEDYFLATTLEVANFDDPDSLSASSGSFTNVLVGLGISWNVPGFRYMHSNVYRAINEAEANDYQLTLAWARPFVFGEHRFLYDGFIDWSSSARDHRASLNWTSQLKHDAGALWDSPETLYWGIEYVYWRNKFGIGNTTSGMQTNESNINLLVKLHL